MYVVEWSGTLMESACYVYDFVFGCVCVCVWGWDTNRKGVFVQNLEEVVCKTAQDIHDILNVASERRQIAETRLNKHSSRSHVITTITIHMKEGGSGVGEEIIKTGKVRSSYFFLFL